MGPFSISSRAVLKAESERIVWKALSGATALLCSCGAAPPGEPLVSGQNNTMVVKCTTTAEGWLENCTVVKTLPFLEQEVLASLYSSRYVPAASYIFNVRLALSN